jgi:hypothetical protein
MSSYLFTFTFVPVLILCILSIHVNYCFEVN